MSLGHGIGLRTKHYREFLETTPQVDWVEAISENFMGLGGRPLAVLEKVRRDRPVVLHGVSLAVGSVAPLDQGYLLSLKDLVRRIQPALVSDHLCWGRAHGRYAHDLLPMPYTEEALEHVVSRVRQVQDVLDRQLLLENVSSYATFKQSELTEWEFLSEVARRADCGLLLDVNNVYVSARNHGFDARAYLDGVPVDRVKQIHLAGHQDRGSIVIDTHEGHVVESVWQLYRHAVARFGAVPSLIEWDEGVPELAELLAESAKAREVESQVLALAHATPSPPQGVRVKAPLAGQLTTTQVRFFDWVTDSQPISGADELVHGGALSADERVGVYAEMYWLRMRDMLREDFARVRRELGDDRFDALVAEYVRAHPSTHHSLNEVGRFMPAFLAEHPRDGLPWLASLATLERARTESFIAPDAPVLALSALASLGEGLESRSLTATHALRLLRLDHEVLARFDDDTAVVHSGPIHVVVWRNGFQVFHVAVLPDEAQALQRVIDARPVSDVCEAFAEREEPATAAFTAIASWVNEGMLSALVAPPVV